jgi:hypothetical protein
MSAGDKYERKTDTVPDATKPQRGINHRGQLWGVVPQEQSWSHLTSSLKSAFDKLLSDEAAPGESSWLPERIGNLRARRTSL